MTSAVLVQLNIGVAQTLPLLSLQWLGVVLMSFTTRSRMVVFHIHTHCIPQSAMEFYQRQSIEQN